jgi:hypothetical protein
MWMGCLECAVTVHIQLGERMDSICGVRDGSRVPIIWFIRNHFIHPPRRLSPIHSPAKPGKSGSLKEFPIAT